eukprot:403358795
MGAHNCDGRTGQELGPNSFREISQMNRLSNQKIEDHQSFIKSSRDQQRLGVVNIDRVKMKIIDCGNIKSVFGEIEETQKNLREYVEQLQHIAPNSIVIVVGGSDDLNFPILQSICSSSHEKQVFHLLRIDPQLDIEEQYRKQFDELEPTFHENNQSYFRMAIENEEIMSKLNKVTFFGLQGHKVSQDQIDSLNSVAVDKFEFIFYDKHLRRYQQSSQEREQGLYNPTIVLNSLLQAYKVQPQLSEQKYISKLIVNLDLQAIKSQYALGVSEPCPAFGFSIEEIEELSYQLGQQNQLKVFTISEYNPAIEKVRTGNILNSIYQNLLLGIAKRLHTEGKLTEQQIKQVDEIKQQNLMKQEEHQDQNQYVYSSILD